jgi:O-antigen/teichoic acid export membrane protein
MVLLPTIAFQAVLSSQLRHDLFVIAEQVMVIVKIIIIIIVIGETKSIIHLALIIAICETFSRVLIVIFAVKLKGLFLLSYYRPSTKIMKGFIKYSTPSIGIWLVERFRGSLPNFSITYYLNLEAIALYNIGFMIATYVGQFLIMSTSPLMPYFTQLLSVTDNKTKKEGTLLKSINYTYGIIIISISFYILGFIFSGKSFLFLFFNIENIEVYYVGIIASFYTLLFCSQHSFSRLFYSKGIHDQLFTLTVIEVCLIMLLSVVLTPAFGIVGQAMSVLLPLFYTRHYLIYKKYQYDDHFNADNLKESSRIWLIPVLVLCPVIYLLSSQIQSNDWLSFIMANVMLILVLSFIYYLYTTKIVMKIWESNIKQLVLNKVDK